MHCFWVSFFGRSLLATNLGSLSSYKLVNPYHLQGVIRSTTLCKDAPCDLATFHLLLRETQSRIENGMDGVVVVLPLSLTWPHFLEGQLEQTARQCATRCVCHRPIVSSRQWMETGKFNVAQKHTRTRKEHLNRQAQTNNWSLFQETLILIHVKNTRHIITCSSSITTKVCGTSWLLSQEFVSKSAQIFFVTG